ncbi:zinc finger CCHC domain-containing protein 8 isoform X3 [Balaenoptera acutorostrata]|uniref:Zinc finger CCHC domain-containing protein 8 isoform X3 n=1 Tax=Balaenoptera acutorostrata TaxID=9767 RepID=A0ABM3RYT4_BALAC|nr:zinc finger CCHC domain-containing protein 8 isoform X3 [Balaenoptera acutorostrata]
MAAEVDFGDLELFEAFDHLEESTPKPVHTLFKDDDGDEEDENGVGDAELRERLRQYEETIEQLRAENQELKRKLNILTRPSGILVNNTKLDGPLFQILFMNNVISKQYHQEIEEFVSNLVKRFEEQQKNDVEKTSFNLLPQPSSVMLEEDHKVEESSAVNNKEAFSPRNAARISEKRKEYMDACGETSNQNFQQRYHAEEVEERFGRFKPGVISEELQDALGVTDKSLPPFIYRMRQLGYPPGWLKEAELETSGLALYDGKDGADGETEAGEVQQNKSVTYDLSKLVNYPGFNISTPRGIPDEWRMFGSIPMQACQQKDVFANYLTSNFQAPSVRSSSKRSSSLPSPSSPKKQKKEGSSAASPADMELDSDAEVPHGPPSSEAFQFQPPLPPGTPPLPRSTPPPIFTPPLPKGTPPLTPSGSPQTRTASVTMDEDALTLEELEEQQRRIWAALEQAESVNSDSDIPVDTPLTGNSVASSPCPNEPDLPVPEGKTSEKQMSDEAEVPDTCTEKSEVEQTSSPDSEAALPGQKQEEGPAEADSEGTLDSGRVGSDCEVKNGGSSQKLLQTDTSPGTTTKIHSPVPDMSKFATGITPFEFENMAESTGMYLRIRNLLKNSPRNQQKHKKASE